MVKGRGGYATQTAKKASATPATAPSTEPDNVFEDAAAAKTWLRDRGLETSLPAVEDRADSGNLILRTIRYLEEWNDELSEAFFTAALLTERAAGVLDNVPSMRLDSESMHDITVAKTMSESNELGRLVKADVEPGTKLIVERPSVLMPRSVSLEGLSTKLDDLFRVLFDRLSQQLGEVKEGKSKPSPSQAMNVRKLKNRKPASSCAEEGIMRTNGIAVELGEETFSALFYRIARINHACSPNAALLWDVNTLTMTVYAVRKLKAEEEVTISYVDVLDSRAERQRKLQLIHGFECACEKCSLVGDALKQSDETRGRLRQWVTNPDRLSFRDWMEQTAAAEITDLQAYNSDITSLFKLVSPEGLTALRGPLMEMSDLLLRMAIALGRKKSANAVLGAARIIWGQGPIRSAAANRRLEEYEEWSKDVTKAPDWNARVTAT